MMTARSTRPGSTRPDSTGHRSVQRALLRAIDFYQVGRQDRPSPCRFTPSCSEYSREAVETFGAGRGTWLTIRRLLRCRPFGPSGYDPVPEPRAQKETSSPLSGCCSSEQHLINQDAVITAPIGSSDSIGRSH